MGMKNGASGRDRVLSRAAGPQDTLAARVRSDSHVSERVLITRPLETACGNQSQAARILRISRDRLRYKIKKHELDKPDPQRISAAAG
jgi:DNA-binding NtrC family response regulator